MGDTGVSAVIGAVQRLVGSSGKSRRGRVSHLLMMFVACIAFGAALAGTCQTAAASASATTVPEREAREQEKAVRRAERLREREQAQKEHQAVRAEREQARRERERLRCKRLAERKRPPSKHCEALSKAEAEASGKEAPRRRSCRQEESGRRIRTTQS